MKHKVPYIGDDFLTHKAHKVGLEVFEGALCKVEENNAEGDEVEHCRVFFKKDLVEDGFDEECSKAVGGCNGRHEDHGEYELYPVGLCEFKKSEV